MKITVNVNNIKRNEQDRLVCKVTFEPVKLSQGCDFTHLMYEMRMYYNYTPSVQIKKKVTPI